ncbi:MAG: cytochrome c [Nitrospira sp.]|nr:cytochrome c [Nitrospira sp.]
MLKGMKFTLFTVASAAAVVSFAFFATQSWAAGDAAKGEKIFKANCVVCHGPEGNGKGPAAAGMTPSPRNFTSATEMKGITEARLHKSITEGRPGTPMVSFAKTLKPGDIDDVIAYIEKFGGYKK